jgi:hypothetical protein
MRDRHWQDDPPFSCARRDPCPCAPHSRWRANGMAQALGRPSCEPANNSAGRFGRNLVEAKVSSFTDDTGKNLAIRFRDNTATGVPYGIHTIRARQVGYVTGQVTAQVFQPEVWVVIGLQVSEELPIFPAPRLQIPGTVKNIDPSEQPVYVRLAAVYSDFIMDTRVALDHSGSFTLAGVIPDGKYVLITIGRTKVLDFRLIDVQRPMAPITIDLAGGHGP